MTKKSDAPAIRFKGFSDAWEQRKLSEITDKVTEKNAGLQYVETFTNSAEFGIISQRDFFDHDIAKLGSLDGYYIVKNEDFVYNPRISTSAPVGPINRNKLGRTGVMSPLYTVFRPHDIDTTYLEYFFKCGYWHSFMNFNGDSGARSDRFSIRDNVFFQMPIPIPDIDEQRKIGELLTCLDNLITLHQRQPFLHSPPDISLIVQLAPPFYTFSWEQRKLGDMMNVTSVKRIHQSDWTDSGVRFLRARDIVAAAKNEEPDDYLYISKEKYEEYSALSGKVGVSDLLVTGVGTIGVPYLVRNLEPLYFKDGNIIWFQNSDKIDGKFLFYSFSAEQIQGFINESAGIGTVGTYTIESGKKTPISLPNQIEQAKVGEFFQQLDNLITLHQRQPFLHSPPDISLIVQLTPPFYTFSWEQRKLASLCEKFTDGDWIESKDQSDFGVRLVQTGNVGVAEYLDKPNNKKWISEDTFDRLHCEEVLPGDILISRLPEPAGRACIVPLLGTKMITAVDCTIVRTAPDMSNKFLVQYLSSQAYFDDVNTCLAGGTRQRISRGNLANFNVPIPVKKSEQDAIGMFFGYLDNLITLHQRQTIVYAVIRSIRKVILAERQYFAPPMVRKSP